MWCVAYKVAALILLSSLSKAEMPEDDFRIINRQDLLATDSSIFEDKDSKSFSQLLFDVARDQIVVGARDYLYRLSLRGLRLLERAEWPAPQDKVQSCQDKGQSEEDCHNYMKVLLSYGHKLFACGTNAFSPLCSWREIESITEVKEWVSGVAVGPFSPRSNVTSLLTSNGDYYAGTPTDFSSSYTAVSRSSISAGVHTLTLRSPQYDQSWLYEPHFVGSFEDDQFVYFVFREIAVEFMNCGKAIYSRIARVCKNDSGGQLMMKDNWSTFLKARLNCSVPGDYPFYYDEVQSVEYLANERLLVATFTTPENSIAGSAVCIYNISDIRSAFDGPYKHQNNPTSTWEPRSTSQEVKDHFNCIKRSPQNSLEYMRYHLMYEAIQPITGEPVYTTTLKRFTHITVDVTPTKKVERQLVAFVATQDSEIFKLMVLPRYNGACLVERWRLTDDKNSFKVLTMQFVKETMSVYVGGVGGVLRVGVSRCARHGSRAACAGAADPYCGWDRARDLCRAAGPPAGLRDHNFAQFTEECSRVDMPVEGGWSSWSEWESCIQDNNALQTTYGEEKPDTCLCRTRQCTNPKPANGGRDCQGPTVSVSNCTVHGGWSAWSGWSQCSASCGLGLKSRRRACNAPEPKHGGRVCVGFDSEEVYCTQLPPCPDPQLQPVDGGWSSWSSWSQCVSGSGAGCGGGEGVRTRRRACSHPAPRNGGAHCDGLDVERQPCDLKPCEPKKMAAASPWVQVQGNSSDGSYVEKRYKFQCKALTSEPVKLSMTKEEIRYCTSLGVCSSQESYGQWEDWGPWGECSVSCGGGQQRRVRGCRVPPCIGPIDMLRPCNTEACTGTWSCWSEWGPCSGAACGAVGRRRRARVCVSPGGCPGNDAEQTQACLAPCDDDKSSVWSEWSDWSECVSGERVRTRRCERGVCTGPQLQAARCGGDDLDNELSPVADYSQNIEMASFVTMPRNDSLGTGGVIGCVLAAFIIGCLLTLSGVVWVGRRGCARRAPRVPSSPHYITAKQNSYVTVPLQDVPRKAKRQPSFSGIGGGSSLLSKSNNISNANNQNNTLTTPKLYPKAIANEYDTMGTLRRHSNLPNRNNLDYEEDKFY